jgi:hypothetical protein
MIKKSNTVSHLLFALYFTMLFMVVLPAHGHEDLAEHVECAVCTLSNQAIILSTVSALIFFLVFLLIILITVRPDIFCHFTCVYPIRAPPLT